MGCRTYKIFLNKADLIELQQYPKELHEKRIQILKWMKDDLELRTKINDYKKMNNYHIGKKHDKENKN